MAWIDEQEWAALADVGANPLFPFTMRYRRPGGGRNLVWDFVYNGGARNLHRFLNKIVEGTLPYSL